MLPNRQAHAAYYYIQRRWGRLQRVDPLPYFGQALNLIAHTPVAHRLEGRVVFEVGTGRTVNVPLAFWLAGAERIITVDLNSYLRPELVMESIQAARSQEREIIALFEKYHVPLRVDRLRSLLACTTMPEVLALARIDYRAPADATRTGLLGSSIDLHISVNVLEHIPPPVLAAIFTEAHRILGPNGVLLHHVDPSDHFAQTDPTLHAAHFLRYSPVEWKRISGNDFMYQNRLRAPEYLRCAQAAGFEVERTQVERDSGALAAIKVGFPVHADFAHMAPEDLAATTLIFSARPR